MKYLLGGLLLTSLFVAQSFPLRFEQFTKKDGLSQVTVYFIIQDYQGFIWASTQEGLNKYDGYTFEKFYNSKDDTTTLPGKATGALFEDSNNRLWISSGGSLVKYNRQLNNFERININGPGTNKIGGFVEDSKGILWFASERGLSSYNYSTKEFNNYYDDSLLAINRDNMSIVTNVLKDNLIYCGTFNGSVYKFDISTKKFTEIVSPKTINNVEVSSLGIDNNFLWIATLTRGLLRYNLSTTELKSYSIEKKNINENSIFKVNTQKEDEVYLATRSGLYKYDEKNDRFEKIELVSENSSLGDSFVVSHILFDRTNNLWLGSDPNGLLKVSSYKNNFKYLTRTANDPNSFPNKTVITFEENLNGDLYIGTFGGGLVKYDKDFNKLKTFQKGKGKGQSLASNNILKLHRTSDQKLLIAHLYNGISILDLNTDKVLGNITYENNPLNFVVDFYEESDNIIWMASFQSGLYRYDPKSEKIQKISYADSTILSDEAGIVALNEDQEGNILIGSRSKGVLYVDKNDNLIKVFPKTELQELERIMCITKDSRDNYWFASTNLGVIKYDPTEKTLEYFLNDFETYLTVYGILEDENQNMWVSTSNGLYLINPISGEIKQYTVHDGLINNEFNQNAFYKSKNNLLFFGGIEGLTFFNPNSFTELDRNEKVVLRSFKLMNKVVKPGPSSQLSKSIELTDQIILNHDDQFFEVEFAAVNAQAPSKIRYAYKMEGFDDHWFFINSDRRFATYTNLSPGEYRFLVTTSEKGEPVKDNIRNLAIIIEPAFWQTWWFYLLLTVVTISILYSIYRYRVNKILEVENLRLKIASDLHDEVGSTLTKVSMRAQMLEMHINGEKESKNLKRISEQAREAVSTMRDIVWSIDSRYDTIKDLVTKMRDTTNNLLSDTGLVLHFQVSGVKLDKDLKPHFRQNIFLVFREALNNIVKHSNATEIVVFFRNFGEGVELIIHDNGDTFQTKNEHSGQGLRNILMRAEKIGGKVSFENNEGFKVILSVPKL